MSQYTYIVKPSPEQWINFHNTLTTCADILKSSKYRPSIKNQGAIIGLLLDQVERCYGQEFTGSNQRISEGAQGTTQTESQDHLP